MSSLPACSLSIDSGNSENRVLSCGLIPATVNLAPGSSSDPVSSFQAVLFHPILASAGRPSGADKRNSLVTDLHIGSCFSELGAPNGDKFSTSLNCQRPSYIPASEPIPMNLLVFINLSIQSTFSPAENCP